MQLHRWLWGIVAIGGCGAPIGPTSGSANHPGTGAAWWQRADPCPSGTKLAGALPPDDGRPMMLTVGWSELACVDGDGEHHGPVVTWWPNRKPYSEGAWDHGLQTGTWSYYYDTGELFARGEYREGIAVVGWTYRGRDGTPLFWEAGGAGCPDGTQLAQDPAAEPSFDYWCAKPDGTRHGPAASWRGYPGWMFTQFRDGNEDGTSTRWGEDRVRYVRVYDDGWQLSETLWYGDHPFSYTEQLRTGGGDGRDNGVQRSWYPDGTIETEGTNSNGCRHGTWTYYDPTGTAVARATYDHCKLVAREDLWHCLDATHLLRPDDVGGGVQVGRVAGEPETSELSTVRLTGGGKDVSLRLWKSNYDDSQGVYSWVIDQVQDVDYMRDDDGFAFQSERATYGGDTAVVFMDLQLGAVALLTCPAPACTSSDAAVALAKIVHRRLLRDRWCVDTTE